MHLNKATFLLLWAVNSYQPKARAALAPPHNWPDKMEQNQRYFLARISQDHLCCSMAIRDEDGGQSPFDQQGTIHEDTATGIAHRTTLHTNHPDATSPR